VTIRIGRPDAVVAVWGPAKDFLAAVIGDIGDVVGLTDADVHQVPVRSRAQQTVGRSSPARQFRPIDDSTAVARFGDGGAAGRWLARQIHAAPVHRVAGR